MELTDVAPTVAAAAGYAEPLYMGRDLAPIAAGEAPARTCAFSEHVDDLLRSMRDDQHVWVETLPDRVNRSGIAFEEGTFFERNGGPAAAGSGASAQRLEEEARALLSSRPEVAAAWGEREAVDEQIAKQLRNLGYL